jgi:hypothetical protein
MVDENELPPTERPASSALPSERSETWFDGWPEHGWQRHHHKRRDLMSGMFWAAMLILAGAVLLADNLRLLPVVGSARPWDWIMLGAGGLMLFFAFIQSISPDLGRPSGFWTIVGIVLVVFGSRNIFFPTMNISFSNWWPVILIVIGLGALSRAFRH